MCGISGFIDFKGNQTNSMVTSLKHIGPDDHDARVYTFDDTQIGFGHTRLGIRDLSKMTHEPMHFEEYRIILNGEFLYTRCGV